MRCIPLACELHGYRGDGKLKKVCLERYAIEGRTIAELLGGDVWGCEELDFTDGQEWSRGTRDLEGKHIGVVILMMVA